MTHHQRFKQVRLALKIIRYQIDDTPECDLLFNILVQTITDLYDPEYHFGAVSFLKRDNQLYDLLGLNCQWIGKVLSKIDAPGFKK